MNIDLSTLGRVETIMFLLIVSTISAVLFKKFRLPYTIGLVPVGIVLGIVFARIPALVPLRNMQLTQELIMYVLLPALIFDASINIDTKLLRKNLTPTLVLAAPGLVIATLITGGLMYYFSGLSLASSMIFGALISATDPVAVISLFEIVGAPRRLRILVDGESLFNDATAIAMFNVVMKMVLAGAALSWAAIGEGAGDFCLVFVGGVTLGVLLGVIAAKLMVFIGDDPHVQMGLSLILAFGSFILADRVFHLSGVMASMGAGIVFNYYGHTRFSDNVKSNMKNFWAFMSFLANSAIFLLLGFTEENILFDGTGVGATFKMIFWAILSIQIARMVVVFGLCPWLGRKENKISFAYQLVMFWGGLRGAVPLALVFGLPADLPEREAIMQITLAVVLFTLVIQGLSTRSLLEKFRLDEPEFFVRLASFFSLRKARRAGLTEIETVSTLNVFEDSKIQSLRGEYEQKLQSMERDLPELAHDEKEKQQALTRLIWSDAVGCEKEVFESYLHTGLLDEKAYRRIVQRCNLIISGFDSLVTLNRYADLNALNQYQQSWTCKLSRMPQFRKLFPNCSRKIIGREFIVKLILLVAARKSREFISVNLESQYDNSPIALSCMEFYEDRIVLLEEDIRELRDLDVTMVGQIQDYSLRKMIYTIESESIKEDIDNGAIPDVEGEKLLDAIADRQRLIDSPGN